MAQTVKVRVMSIHPSPRFCPSEIWALQELLKVPGVVGLGEVGLDHSLSPTLWVDQLELLLAVLPMATPQLVLVLHCRGMQGQEST